MEKDPNKWKTIAACILLPMVMATVLVTWVGKYAHLHPGSFLAYSLFKVGVRTFEPSFADKREGVGLFGELRSYSSIAEITNHFNAKSTTVGLEFEQQVHVPTKGESRWIVKSCSDLGQRGDLLLIFLNDRLVTTSFFPYQPDQYFAALGKEKGIVFDKSGELYIQPFTKVRRALNRYMHPSVIWSDERLNEQKTLWMMRYPNYWHK